MTKSKATRAPRKKSEVWIKADKLLEPFFKANKPASLVELGKESTLFIMQPWGDRSVALFFPDDPETVASHLNNLILPERLSAIYHRDIRALEVIFTAYKLEGEDAELIGRNFSISLDGKALSCSFKSSSERLIFLGRMAVFPTISETAFRNLQSFHAYHYRQGEKGQKQSLGEPISFWIENIDWKEEETLDVLNHINFYLRYYDANSPYIVVHPPADQHSVNPKNRYIEGKFPASISSRRLDPTLLSFWNAAQDEESANKFLFYFRIIEYVTSYYLQAEQRNAVQKVLASPSLGTDPQAAMDRLVAVIREEKPQDTVRFSRTVVELVSEDKIWNEICANPDSFTKETKFDGGFTLGALVANTSSKDCFGPKGLENFARALRNIRNGLTHGGEAQAGRIILPTERNFKKLQPWVHLIATAAGEVVLYEHLT